MKEKQYEKYMKQISWFHGTTLKEWKKICKYKVQSDYNKGTELDFGQGFYLAPSYRQAANYISRYLPYQGSNEIAVVIEFELCLDYLRDKYKHTRFLHFDEEFADFVIMNRDNPTRIHHDYDFIVGVMTDSNPRELMKKYRKNIITHDELRRGLMKWNSMEQVSLHNQEICDILNVKKITIVNTGKELDFNEYGRI